MPYQALATFIACVCVGLLVAGLTRFKGQHIFNFRLILWRSVYSAVVGPFLFLPVAWWMRIRTHRLRQY
jgi:cell shape-determining protein MreD